MLANLKIDIWGPLKGTTEDVDLSDLLCFLQTKGLLRLREDLQSFLHGR